ncbi:uncharacterized protein LOC103574088 [Microplitis demolitor]|uniref:uncharacterized protein LOC103574088 n=1 Tax=Microplitis demolitor TaxID=69319 RepID=UPI0004CCA87A|nr:uncharacterized protein LOC103574088 [Microplitis demolitor]
MGGFYLEPLGSTDPIPLPESKGYTCGRERTNDVMLMSPSISRKHCLFMIAQNRFQVWDLNSSNGTYINGRRIVASEFHNVAIDDILGISCDKTENFDADRPYVYRLKELSLKQGKEFNDENVPKEELGQKRKSNGVSPIPSKMARTEVIDLTDDCVMIDAGPAKVKQEPEPPVDQPPASIPSINDTADNNDHLVQAENLIKYELDIPEEMSSAVNESLIANGLNSKDIAAQEAILRASVNGPSSASTDKVPDKLTSNEPINEDTNSNDADMFSDSPTTSPKNSVKSNEFVVTKQEFKPMIFDKSIDVIVIDDEDEVVFPASQLFDDPDANDNADGNNDNAVEDKSVSSIIKEECDLGTDEICYYNNHEEADEVEEETEYPVIVLSDDDDDDEYNTETNPWFLKLSGSQLESQSIKEEPDLVTEPIDNFDNDDDVNGLLDELNKDDFLMETEDFKMTAEITAQDAAVVGDDAEAVKQNAAELVDDVADTTVADSGKEELKKPKEIKKKDHADRKTKKEKKKEKRKAKAKETKMDVDGKLKENDKKNDGKDKAKNKKSEKCNNEVNAANKSLDVYDYRESFEKIDVALKQYRIKQESQTKKKKKDIVIRSDIEMKTPIVKSIVIEAVRPSPGPSNATTKVNKSAKVPEKHGSIQRKVIKKVKESEPIASTSFTCHAADELSSDSSDTVATSMKRYDKEGKEDRKDKSGHKKLKGIQEDARDKEKIKGKEKEKEKEKNKEREKEKAKPIVKNDRRSSEESTSRKSTDSTRPLFEEALVAGDRGTGEDLKRKKIKKKKIPQEVPIDEEQLRRLPTSADFPLAIATLPPEVPTTDSSKTSEVKTDVVINGRRVSISSKKEKKIQTIEPPVFTRGGRHGVSATFSAAAVASTSNADTNGATNGTVTSNDSDNQEEDYDSALFSKCKKLPNSSKSNDPMEEQKLRLRNKLRAHEIRGCAKALSKAASKKNKEELIHDRRERLKQLAEEQRKSNENNATTKRINKPRAKVSKNRGLFLIPEGADLDTTENGESEAETASTSLNNGPVFDLHAEVIKTNHMNTNPTAVDDLFDVISTRSCPGYAEPPPPTDQDDDDDNGFDIDNITGNNTGIDMDIEDTFMDYTSDVDLDYNQPTTSSRLDNNSNSRSYSKPTLITNAVFLPSSTVANNYSNNYSNNNSNNNNNNNNNININNINNNMPKRISGGSVVKPIRGILKKTPNIELLNNYLPNNNNNFNQQLVKTRKKISFSNAKSKIHYFQILPGNKLVRKCIQKDATMPKPIEKTLPGDPSNYLPDLSAHATPKVLPVPPAPVSTIKNHCNVLTLRHNNIMNTNGFSAPKRISAPTPDQFLLRVFEWNPLWLDPAKFDQKAQKNLPIVEDGQMPHLSWYANYTDYYSIMSALMLLEMWAGIVKDSNDKEYKKKRSLMFGAIGENSITQTPIRSTNSTITIFTVDILRDKFQIDKKIHPNVDDLVMLELAIVTGDRTIQFQTIFAYVKDFHKTVLTPLTPPYNRCLNGTVPNAFALMTFTMITKSLPLNIKFTRPQRLRTMFFMRPSMRSVQAVQFLSSSPLFYPIIQPDAEKEVYTIKKVSDKTCKFATGDKLNDKQREAVMSITSAVLERTPKICLVEGPPGTGKSRVIVNIVTEIMYGQNRYKNNDRRRILVCAPSNAAIDEITLRLMDIRSKFKADKSHEPFKMVRVGNAKSMHPRVHDISISELASRSLSKAPGDTSGEIEKSRLNTEIVRLRATLESAENIPEGERIKLKKKYDDYITQIGLLENCKQIRQKNNEKQYHQEKKLLATADVITCTLSSCYTTLMESTFGKRSDDKKISICIVDEATQCCEPEALIPLMLGVVKLVLVGDPQQLPATVLSSKAKDLKYDKSLFSRIYERFEGDLNNPVISLDTQYRMVHPIVYWPNRFFYNNQLKTSFKPGPWPYSSYKVFNLTSVQDNNAYSNSDEATFVVNLIHTMATCTNFENVEGVIKIGVITPYQDQRKLISIKLADRFANVPDDIKHKIVTEVNTVDSFQGQEREIIIMSCVRSNGIGFLSDRQRLCVALTRAKNTLFLCGNFKTFEKDETWGALIKDARSRNFYINIVHQADADKIKQHAVKEQFFK